MHSGKIGRMGWVAVWMVAAASPLALGQSRSSRDPARLAKGEASGSQGVRVASSPSVSTDQADYAPGDTAIIYGAGFAADDTITLQVTHIDGTPPGGEGHNPWTAVSDADGNFTSTWFVNPDDSGGSTFLLTADGSGLHAETTFTDVVGGNGVVTSVTADDGGCVAVSANATTTVWDVQPGSTYTVTISGVNDAANGGTDATMPVHLQNATTGSLCLTAENAGTGVYTVQISVPVYACDTSPINYGSCDNNAKRAKGNAADADSTTTTNGVHLRSNTTCAASDVILCSSIQACCMDGECSMRTMSNCFNTTTGHAAGIPAGPGVTCDDSPCTPHRCDIGCPDEITVDCAGSTDPADTGIATCGDGRPATSSDDIADGVCPQESNISRSWNCACQDGTTASCVQLIHVVDTTPPTVTCPDDCVIECGQTTCTPPLCDDDGCQCGGEPSCTDDCGDCTITSTCEFINNECPSITAGVTPPPKTGTVQRTFTSTDGVSTVAVAGCPNTASCTQTIKIVDTIAPVITCSGNLTVHNDPGQCCATVNYTTTATDSCDDTPMVDCSRASGTCFPMGTTTVNCLSVDDCSNEADCSFTVTVTSSICGSKKYDANGDGVGETGIAGWKVELSGDASATRYTDANGDYCFNDLAPGSYTVTEVAPNGTWINTSPTSCSFTDLGCGGSCHFNNLCLGAGGGLTLGYWSNKNGQATMNDGGTMAPELALLSGLCLRKASGADFNPSTYASFRSWILDATATNMAYMLSAQLAAMELNVESGRVGGGSFLHAPGCGEFASVNSLMAAANAALCADGYTPDGDPNRTLQECLKNALDRGNNDRNFVQTTACPFSPY